MKGYRNWDQAWGRGARVLIATFFCAGAACLFGSGTQPTIAPKHTPLWDYQDTTPKATARALAPTLPEKVLGRSLTFAERVAYQRAMEEVYWRHRIWPKENSGLKPLLDLVISRAGLEKKVRDYLRKSQVLESRWQQPIVGAQLQGDIDRMARDTKQPGLLRELFNALGNDPFVIAECLARPILVDRLPNRLPESLNSVHSGVSPYKNDDFVYTLPKISAATPGANDTWTSTSNVNAPDVRAFHAAVWTGSEMILWGGGNIDENSFNTGFRYTPGTDSWASTSVAGAPPGRAFHTAVWTGSDMIVWGGADEHDQFNSGSKYNPVTDAWTAITTTNAPVLRDAHSAVWTGREMIVWGGWGGPGCNSNCMLNSGGRYNPETDTWSATSTVNAPSVRWDFEALWTGSQMIVWGGTDQTNYLRTGGRYDPATDSWTPTSLVNAPPGRTLYAAVWTGSQMIVWGGLIDGTFQETNTGGRYNPITDSWVATSLVNVPSQRSVHSAVWTGREMIVWSGTSSSGEFNTGGRYDPGTDSWTPTTTLNAPMPRSYHTGVWTGNEMIVWGGLSYNTGYFVNTGGCYSAQPFTPTVQSAVSRKSHGNAGNFDINFPLSGLSGIECRSGGGAGDYTIVVTFLANVSMNANPQATVSSGIAMIGSGGVGNGGVVMTSGNVVTIPLTNVSNAQTINVTLNNVNGSTNVTIPMRVLIGDVNGNGTVNATDVSQTKLQVGQAVSTSNFRCDVNAGGAINATDVSVVKSQSGTALP